MASSETSIRRDLWVMAAMVAAGTLLIVFGSICMNDWEVGPDAVGLLLLGSVFVALCGVLAEYGEIIVPKMMHLVVWCLPWLKTMEGCMLTVDALLIGMMGWGGWQLYLGVADEPAHHGRVLFGCYVLGACGLVLVVHLAWWRNYRRNNRG